MDNLQYIITTTGTYKMVDCFKPYYKWITFNTISKDMYKNITVLSFKPYYKWITFNTKYRSSSYT